MNKILVLTKDNRLLLSKQLDNEILVDDSIEIAATDHWMVIRLLKDYESNWDVEVIVTDWEIMYREN